jgi:hypothetical protein
MLRWLGGLDNLQVGSKVGMDEDGGDGWGEQKAFV